MARERAARLLVFLRVVLGKAAFRGVVLVVKLWWIAGKTWCAGWSVSGAEKHANF